MIGIQALDPRKTPQCSRGASGSLQFPSLGVRCPPLNFLICTHAPTSFRGCPGLLPKLGLALDPEDTEEMPPSSPPRPPASQTVASQGGPPGEGGGVFRTLQDGSGVVGFQAGEQGDCWGTCGQSLCPGAPPPRAHGKDRSGPSGHWSQARAGPGGLTWVMTSCLPAWPSSQDAAASRGRRDMGHAWDEGGF